MEAIQKQLGKATSDLQAQQQVISNSEEFVKHVFSSHITAIYNLPQIPTNQYKILPRLASSGNSVLLLILPSAPIPGTLQIQYSVLIEPPNSFTTLHNLLIFFWGDPPETLKQKQISISYFPDSKDKDLIHSLSEHDGRIFADGEPLPKFNQPDPDFKGDKWIPAAAPKR